jgi:cytochrome c551/c552
MRNMLVILSAAGIFAAGVALAQSGPEVLKVKGCGNCHEADKKKVGPSYKDIAAKGGDAKAIAAKLKDGKGHPKIAASDAELDAAVTHVLSMK